jgi:hypothetical protein
LENIKTADVVDSGFVKEMKTSNKGRKRTNKILSSNFYDFMADIVQPKWEDSLEKTSMKQREIEIRLHGPPFLWYELFKDIRKVRE